MTKKIILGLALVGVLTLTACSSETTEEDTTNDDEVESTVDSEDNGEEAETNDERLQFTAEELAQFDGKDGNDCYVAVDGVVWQIEGSDDWVDGEHTKSRGQAKCGMDLTEVLANAPHGDSVLDGQYMTEIGDFFSF